MSEENTREYYGYTRDLKAESEFRKNNIISSVRVGFITACIAMTSFCSMISMYQVLMMKDQRVQTINQLSDINSTIFSLTEYINRDLKPRLNLMDRVVTYQLPTTILKAFEVSYNDLRTTMEQIVVDTEKLIGLYKAILGFSSDWNIDPTAQRLRCYWEDDTVEDYVMFNDSETIEMITAVNKTLQTIDGYAYDFSDVASEIRNAFYTLYDFIGSLRNNGTIIESPENNTLTQLNSYLNNYCKYFKSKEICVSMIKFTIAATAEIRTNRTTKIGRMVEKFKNFNRYVSSMKSNIEKSEREIKKHMRQCLQRNNTNCKFEFGTNDWTVSIDNINEMHELIHPLLIKGRQKYKNGKEKRKGKGKKSRTRRYYVQKGTYRLPTYDYKQPEKVIPPTPPQFTEGDEWYDMFSNYNPRIRAMMRQNPLLNYHMGKMILSQSGCYDQHIPPHTIRYCKKGASPTPCPGVTHYHR